MITFKQFLVEGGAATKKLGTTRATRVDIDTALTFVSHQIGIGTERLRSRLLGSTRLTALGFQDDSGDIDIAIHEGEVNRDQVVARLTKATGNAPYVTGGNTYSFAVPVGNARKVQVDLMFIPDIKWALFSYHADERSTSKSGVRNELLHAALRHSMVKGEDVRMKDDAGNDVARASRAYKLDQGIERIFKIAPLRKNGNGRVKGVVNATPNEVRNVLDKAGNREIFSQDKDIIRDPDRFARLLFGENVKGADMMTAEQIISLIKKYKKKDATAIFHDAIKGILRLKLKVPLELKAYTIVP